MIGFANIIKLNKMEAKEIVDEYQKKQEESMRAWRKEMMSKGEISLSSSFED